MKFSEFPLMETERLKLRRMSKSDAADLFAILSDGDVTKDMGVAPLRM